MLNEQDIELIEMHLDGELDQPAADALRERLAADPEFAAELDRLRQARLLRQAAWQSFEQPAPNVERVLGKLQARQTRYAWLYWIHDQRERIAAIAACFAVFVIGWQWGRAAPYRLVPGNMAGATPVILQQQVPGTGTGARMFEVQVKDATGKVVRQERFQTIDEAQTYILKIEEQLRRQQRIE